MYNLAGKQRRRCIVAICDSDLLTAFTRQHVLQTIQYGQLGNIKCRLGAEDKRVNATGRVPFI